MPAEVGLKLLSPGEDPLVDIVFVHGLRGHWLKTWAHSNGTVWPLKLLPVDLPNARIFTYGYDADVAQLTTPAGRGMIRDHANTFVHDLVSKRSRDDTTGRPLLFVAHGMGGLLVDNLLTLCFNARDTTYKQVATSTYGIVFMGTPHAGSDLANWGVIMGKMVSVFTGTNQNLLKLLEPTSQVLATLQQSFQGLLQDLEGNHNKWIEIFSFYEECPYKGVMVSAR